MPDHFRTPGERAAYFVGYRRGMEDAMLKLDDVRNELRELIWTAGAHAGSGPE